MTNVYKDFFVRSSHDFSLRFQQDLIIPSVNSVFKGKNSLRYFGSVIWNYHPDKIINSETLLVSKSKISVWSPDSCTCRLCKEYIGGVDFM